MSVKFDEDVFKHLKKMMTENDYVFEDCDSLYLNSCNELLGYISVSDGSSYDGFWNFTDGFLEQCFYFDPIRYGSFTGFRFEGTNPKSKKRAEFMNKYLDELCKPDSALSSYWYDHIRNTKLQKRWEKEEDFISWYKDFIPGESHFLQIGLFTDKPVETKLHEKDDELFDDIQQNYVDNWFSESPAFIKITVILYDESNYRSGHERRCKVYSSFNDDFGYGRESVGSWAGKGWTGEGIGDHAIYYSNFKWTTPKDLYKKIRSRLEKAYKTIC